MTVAASEDLRKSEEDLLNLLDAAEGFERKFLGNRFNLFEAVNMTRQEIRHSRFLAFLLNPWEPHGLGDRFLRRVLSAVVAQHPDPGVSRLDVAIADLGGVSVHCERDHFDISVEVRSLDLLLVIENKVGAGEGIDQLRRYRELAEKRYPDLSFCGCFLTPDGNEGEDGKWGALSYSTIALELRGLLVQEEPSGDEAIVLRHYIELIERKIVASQDLIDACKAIYQKHKAALDLIIDHGQESTLENALDLFLAGVVPGQMETLAVRRDTAYFIFKSWLSIDGYPRAERPAWNSDFPVRLWFEVLDTKLTLFLQVGPFKDARSDRPEFVSKLRTALEGVWPDARSRGRGGSDTQTRVVRFRASIPEDASADDLSRAMADLWNKHKAGQLEAIVASVVAEASMTKASDRIAHSGSSD